MNLELLALLCLVEAPKKKVAASGPVIDGPKVDIDVAWYVASTGAVHHATIKAAAKELAARHEGIRVDVAHGQMTEDELADVMARFAGGEIALVQVPVGHADPRVAPDHVIERQGHQLEPTGHLGDGRGRVRGACPA